MRLLIALFVALSFFSCQKNSLKDKIQGVWIYHDTIKKQHLKDTSDLPKYEYLFDFKSTGELIIKESGSAESNYNWKISEDSITFDNVNYKIKSISDKRLILIKHGPDTSFLFYVRPKKIDIKYSVKEIEKLLLSKIWIPVDSIANTKSFSIEYFENQKTFKKYQYFNQDIKDYIYNFEDESWGIYDYKGFVFLYGKGYFHHRLNQINSISDTSFTTLSNNNNRKENKFVEKRQKDKREEHSKLLQGNWVSINSKDKRYIDDIEKVRIKTKPHSVEYFEGKLNLKIIDNELKYYIYGLQPREFIWSLSRDAKTLILEGDIEGSDEYSFLQYSILKLTQDSFKIRMNTTYTTGIRNPYIYLLNDIQEFNRVE